MEPLKKSEKRSSISSSETASRRNLRHSLSALVNTWLATPPWRRGFVCLTVAVPLLWLSFPGAFSSILYSLSSLDAIQFEGSYPITMLALAAIFLFLKRAAVARMTVQNTDWLSLLRSLLLGILLVMASLQLNSFSPVGFIPSIFTTAFFLVGFLIIALPDASRLIVPLTCLYVAAVSLPTFIQAFLNDQASALYILSSMPILSRLGCSAQAAGQVISFQSSGGNIATMHVDSSCAGSGAFSVFLFLSGLMYLLARGGKKRTVLLVSGGAVALYSLNVLRLVVLVSIGCVFSSEVMWQAHSYLGYLLFVPFYFVFPLVFFRLVKRGSLKTIAAICKKALGLLRP